MFNASEIATWLQNLQKSVCDHLELLDAKASFIVDPWEREEGGGGKTAVLSDGNIFEKAGVAFSAIHGTVPDFLKQQSQHSLTSKMQDAKSFFASGVSLVIHPINPHIPTIHMNIRYFSTDNNIWWFGGGIDLTPIYVVKEDAHFFHQSLKAVCDPFDKDYYSKFKSWADDYFYIKHRNETRGIGGIFFDTLQSENNQAAQNIFEFWKQVGLAFNPIYGEIVNRNRDKAFTDSEVNWQHVRRGRYVEFNLVYDRGTKFGLETGGRVESILMSLPKHASWQYNFKPDLHSKEAQTLDYLKKGINWID
jgi:coproporphyrinogen III oxidase